MNIEKAMNIFTLAVGLILSFSGLYLAMNQKYSFTPADFIIFGLLFLLASFHYSHEAQQHKEEHNS